MLGFAQDSKATDLNYVTKERKGCVLCSWTDGGCEVPSGCWELNPLQEQQVLLTAEAISPGPEKMESPLPVYCKFYFLDQVSYSGRPQICSVA